jgi:hypothetical protein
MGELPAHGEHEAEAEEEEQQTADSVPDADDFVIGGKDVLSPKAKLVVIVVVIVARLVAMPGVRVSFNVG